jgi:hypothetical protein
MTLSIDIVLYAVAAILFGLDGFKVPAAVSWTAMAFCVLTISLIVRIRRRFLF